MSKKGMRKGKGGSVDAYEGGEAGSEEEDGSRGSVTKAAARRLRGKGEDDGFGVTIRIGSGR